MTSKAKAAIAFALALALVVVKTFGPDLMSANVRLLPTDTQEVLQYEPTAALLFDAAAWENNTPTTATPACTTVPYPSVTCFMSRPTLHAQRSIAAHPADSRKDVRYEVTDTIDDAAGVNLYRATDELTLIRHSSFPADLPAASFSSTATLPGFSHSSTAELREGLQYAFPFRTEFRSYEFFDNYSATTHPIDFQDREVIDGVTLYRFHQQLPPIQLSTNTLKGPAFQFYSPEEAQAEGLIGTSTIVLSLFYTMSRTLWVEPKTGTIVDSVENPLVFLARDIADAEKVTPDTRRTLFSTTLRWDDATKEKRWKQATAGLVTLKIVDVTVLLSTIFTLLLLGYGIIQLRFRD